MNLPPLTYRTDNIHHNPPTTFNKASHRPHIPYSSTIHHNATVIGPVIFGQNIFVAPAAVIRADEGHPIYVGNNSNIQDGVVIHGFKNKPHESYSVVIGNNVSVAHQSLIHGPVYIGDNSFVGFKAGIYGAVIGKDCVVEHCAQVENCHVPDGRYVPSGQIIDSQEKANALPVIDDNYKHKHLNECVVNVNKELAQGYGLLYNNSYPPSFRFAQMPFYQPPNGMLKFKGIPKNQL